VKIILLSFILLFLLPSKNPLRVTFVSSPLDADIIICEAKEKTDADMVIFLTKNKAETGDANWIKVQLHEQPDKKVYISNNQGKKVYFTKNKSESRIEF
jgi:hypothetical protein